MLSKTFRFATKTASKALLPIASRAVVSNVQTFSPIVRCFSDNNQPDQSLSDVLIDEFTLETQNDEVDTEYESVKAEVLKHFKVIDAPGSTKVQMISKTATNETVTITFDCTDEVEIEPDFEEEEENEEEMDIETGIAFDVTIAKGNDKVVVNCLAHNNYEIRNVQFLPQGKESDDLYKGPVFDQLADPLKDALYFYLENRGITADLSYFILLFARNKEQDEYKGWLKNMAAFTDEKPLLK